MRSSFWSLCSGCGPPGRARGRLVRRRPRRRADRPDVVTGQQVHAVVAIPADARRHVRRPRRPGSPTTSTSMHDVVAGSGPDPGASLRPRRRSAAEACARHLVRQAPGDQRGVRSRRTRAPRSSESRAISEPRPGQCLQEVPRLLRRARSSPSVCGTGGGGLRRRPESRSCGCRAAPSVPTDDDRRTRAAARPRRADPPAARILARPTGGSGHPCDSTSDMLYPFAIGRPLTLAGARRQPRRLLRARRDLARHPGFALAAPPRRRRTSRWPSLLGGAGEITSDLPGVDCTAACTTQWDQGTRSRLTAAARRERPFRRLDGCLLGQRRLRARPDRGGDGHCGLRAAADPGSSSRSPARGAISCTPTCGKTFPGGDPLTLRAVPAKGWKFARWSGALQGHARSTAARRPTYSVAVRATFTKKR